MISNKDITVVAQGPIVGDSTLDNAHRKTLQCLERVRAYLPGARIILSTWENSDVAGLSYDELLLNEDPGPISTVHLATSTRYPPDRPNNVNRQIVSTWNGLKLVETKYAIKLRTDFLITGSNFIDLFEKYNSSEFDTFDKNWKIFKKRIFTLDIFSRNPNHTKTSLPFVYHPSDLFHFGLTEDISNFWDIPLMDAATSVYFKNQAHDDLNDLDFNHRYCIEQYLWLAVMQKNGIRFSAIDRYYESTEDQRRDTEKSFLNNFVIYDYRLTDVYHDFFDTLPHDHAACYNFYEWLNLYRVAAGQRYKLPVDYLRYKLQYRKDRGKNAIR